MNHNDEFIGHLEDYLHEFDGATPLPDRVRDAVRAELPRTRQVHRPGPLRMFTMLSNASSGARLGLVAAAFVVAAVLGVAVLNNRSTDVGGAAPPTPAKSLSPSVAPTAMPSLAGPAMLGSGTAVACEPSDTNKSCLAAGTYQLTGYADVWPATVAIDVPAGWFEPMTGYLGTPGSGWDAVLVNGGADTNYNGSGWGVMFTTVGDVFRDPCDASKGTIPAAQVDTPQKLAAAIAAWPKFTTTTPHPITVDGHAGLELTVSHTTEAGCGSGVTWRSASNAVVDAYPFSSGRKYRTNVRIVDTGRGLLVMRAADFADTSPFELQNGVAQSPTRHAADQPQLQAILDSVRIAAPASSPSP
jgi:hypothetical protein